MITSRLHTYWPKGQLTREETVSFDVKITKKENDDNVTAGPGEARTLDFRMYLEDPDISTMR